VPRVGVGYAGCYELAAAAGPVVGLAGQHPAQDAGGVLDQEGEPVAFPLGVVALGAAGGRPGAAVGAPAAGVVGGVGASGCAAPGPGLVRHGAPSGIVRAVPFDKSKLTINGPWMTEPDDEYWTDEATGLPCLILRGPVGALNGYVGVPPGHPWHGLSCFGEDSAVRVRVHGDLTYADQGPPNWPSGSEPSAEVDAAWWFGFDCAHYDDIAPFAFQHLTPEARERAISDPKWGQTYKTFAYVRAEVTDLAAQLAAAARH